MEARHSYLDLEPDIERPKLSAQSVHHAPHFSATRQPWKSFFKARVPENVEEATSRLRKNLLHFQANYLAMTAALLAALQLNNPLGLCATLLVSVLWALAPQLTSEALSPQRLALLAALSLMVLYLAAGTMLLNLAFMSLLFSGLHAALHPGSVEVGNFDLIDEVPNAAPVGTAWRQVLGIWNAYRHILKLNGKRMGAEWPWVYDVDDGGDHLEINPEHVEDDAVLSEKWPVSNTWSVDCWDVVSQPTLADWHRLGLLTVNVEAPHFENVQAAFGRWTAFEAFAKAVGFRRPRGGGSGDPGGAGRGIRTVPMDLTGDAAWHVPEESAEGTQVASPTAFKEASELKASRPQSEAPEINISKKGKKLGLRYDDSDGLALVIKIIDPGFHYGDELRPVGRSALTVDELGRPTGPWKRPGKRTIREVKQTWQTGLAQAMPEDRIIVPGGTRELSELAVHCSSAGFCEVEVNGVRGKSEWLEEQCMKSDVLTLTLERVLPAPNERIFGQSEDPTVIVHAYDLFGHGKGPMACMSRTLNSMSTRFGLFHTGVEVFGREWFFGASLEGLFHGVNCTEPKQHPVHRYRTSVALGTCKITAEAFEELMPLIRMKWPAWSYHAISRNCHSFTDFFCKILGFESAPRFGLFGSGDAMLVPGGLRAWWGQEEPCGSCASLKTGEAGGHEGSRASSSAYEAWEA
ncbi:DeSI-like protein At4g17486 [Durusdinium trenchii]|uniref:DeSI-like protein At4g17486 n=1 Tax=Durusdinium trenchii TaxID=1381693 RepID=A0ABP0IPA9_9DINO